jgi:hypothetical protein
MFDLLPRFSSDSDDFVLVYGRGEYEVARTLFRTAVRRRTAEMPQKVKAARASSHFRRLKPRLVLRQ